MHFLLISALSIILGLTGCTQSDQKTPNVSFKEKSNLKKYKITESFNVGTNVYVRALVANPRNQTLWVGTSIGALEVNSHTGEVNQTFTRDNGLANEYVFSGFVADDDSTWFGTNGGGVSRLVQGKWTTYFPLHGLADYWVYSFVEEKTKAMWIGTWAGLSRFDYKTRTFKTYLKELVNEWVYGLDIDSRGHVWIGTEGGINRFDGETWQVWTHEQGLGAPNKRGLSFSTNTGLGTRSRHDLSVLVGGQETYNPNYVFCIKVDNNDTVWAGTWGGGVSYFDGKQWRNLSNENGLAGNIVYSIEIDDRGNYWFGTNKGLSIYNGDQWQTLSKKDGLLDSHVYAIAITANNKIWAGTKNGVAVIEQVN